MRKIGVVFMVLLALITCGSGVYAASVTSYTLVNCEDFVPVTSGGAITYKSVIEYILWDGTLASEEISPERGKSIKVIPGTGKAPDLYYTGVVTGDVGVYGFSVYADISDNFSISEKGVSGSWSASDSINGLFALKDGQFTLMGNTIKSIKQEDAGGAWYDIRIILNHDTHRVKVYINNEFAGEDSIDESITTIGRFIFVFRANEEIYFDDFVAYPLSPADKKVKTSVEGGVAKFDISEITLEFDKEVLKNDLIAGLSVIDSAGTEVDVSVECDGIGDFVKTVVINLNESLERETGYKILLNGIYDLAGNDISTQISFVTTSDKPTVTISTEAEENQGVCASVKMNINTINVENPFYEYYNNGEIIGSAGKDSFIANLAGGINEIYVIETTTGSESNHISINCEPYDTKVLIYESDFSQDASSGLTVITNSGSAETTEIDAQHGKSMKLTWGGTGNEPALIFPSATKYNGIFVWQADYYIGELNAQNLLSIKTDTNMWLVAIGIDNSGKLCYRSAGNTLDATSITMKKGDWINIKLLLDTESWTYTAYADGKKIANAIKIPVSGSKVQYVNFSLKNPPSGETACLALDNVKQYFITGRYEYSASFGDTSGEISDSKCVPYKNTEINVSFSEAMQKESISAAAVTDSDGNAVECNVNYVQDSNTAVITFLEALLPNMKYTVSLLGVKSYIEGKPSGSGLIEFKTDKLPYCIKSWSSVGTDKMTVNVIIRNSENDTRSSLIFAGIYDGNKLKTISSSKVIPGQTDYSITLNAPENLQDCSVEIYLLYDNFELIDAVVD